MSQPLVGRDFDEPSGTNCIESDLGNGLLVEVDVGMRDAPCHQVVQQNLGGVTAEPLDLSLGLPNELSNVFSRRVTGVKEPNF